MSRSDPQIGRGQRLDVNHRVVEEVADTLGRDPLELEPLHDRIDADGLIKSFRGDFDGQIRSRYPECTVELDDEDLHCVKVSDHDAP